MSIHVDVFKRVFRVLDRIVGYAPPLTSIDLQFASFLDLLFLSSFFLH